MKRLLPQGPQDVVHHSAKITPPTDLERYILYQLAAGLTYHEIARELRAAGRKVGREGVKYHVVQLTRKYRVHNNTQIVMRALQLGHIQLGMVVLPEIR